MKQTSKVAFGILLINFIFFVSQIDPQAQRRRTGSSQRASSNLSLDQQAEQQARAFWNARITRCGDDFYTRDRIYVHQFRNLRIEVRARSVSTADRLNGIEYIGSTSVYVGQSRTHSPRSTLYQDAGWGRWSEGFTSSMGGVGLDASLRKENGRWSVTPSSISQAGVLKPVDCSNLLGFTSSSFVEDKRISWVSMRAGQGIPNNAIVGGVELGGDNDGVTLYVCRANYNGSLHPGKLINGYCNIGYGGKEVIFSDYQVATGNGFWGRPKSGYAGALIGGWETERKLYVCRANFLESSDSGLINHGQHPGKIVGGKCNFGFGTRELGSDDFEVFYPKPQ